LCFLNSDIGGAVMPRHWLIMYENYSELLNYAIVTLDVELLNLSLTSAHWLLNSGIITIGMTDVETNRYRILSDTLTIDMAKVDIILKNLAQINKNDMGSESSLTK